MDISVREAKALEGLRFWKLQEFITIHQASMLAIGLDPGNNLFGFEPFVPRSGYEPIKLALTTKLTQYYYKQLDTQIDNQLDVESSDFDEIFCPENIKSATHEGGDDNDIALYRIRQTAIKDWLQSEGIYSAYFESLSDNPKKNHGSTKALSINYSTNLMSIMYETIERYYGKNFSIEDKDTYPKQEHVTEWLKTQFSLSKRQAEAIEIIISPRNDVHPEDKSS